MGVSDLSDISTKSKPSPLARFSPSSFEQTLFSTLSPTNLIVSAKIKLFILWGFSFFILQGLRPLFLFLNAITICFNLY